MAELSQESDQHDLTDIDGVGPEKAESLREADVESVEEVCEASTDELAEADGIGSSLATEIKENAEEVDLDADDAETDAGRNAESAGSDAEPALDVMTVRSTVEDIAESLVDEPFDGIIEIERDEEHWYAVVEVVERSAVPDTQDIIGRYEIDLDSSGTVTAYRLTDRYRRGTFAE